MTRTKRIVGFASLLILAVAGTIAVKSFRSDSTAASSRLETSDANKRPAFKDAIPLEERIAARIKQIEASQATVRNPDGQTRIVSFLDPNDPFSVSVYRALREISDKRSDLRWELHWNPDAQDELSAFKAELLIGLADEPRFWETADLMMGSRLNSATRADTLALLERIGHKPDQIRSRLDSDQARARSDGNTDLRNRLQIGRGAVVFISGVRMYDLEVIEADTALAMIDKVAALSN